MLGLVIARDYIQCKRPKETNEEQLPEDKRALDQILSVT